MIPVRRPVLVLAALLALLPLPALAVDLPQALATTDARTGVVTARLDLGDARRAQERTDADPAALRLDRLQARQTLDAAESALRAARFTAYADVAGAYLQVLEARAGVALAEDAVALAERAVEIARIRLERGAATELDLRDAETDLASARNDLQSARQGADLAARSFTSLTGLDAGELEPVPAAWLETTVPDEEAWIGRLDAAPTVLQARQGVELARTARELLDPAYAPARDIEAAELRVAQAEEGLAEARRGVRLQLRSLLDRVASAREGLVVARDALANAEERDRVDRSRLEAGLIAEIAYDQTRLATRQARDAVQRAEHELVRALFALQADTGLGIEGLDAF